MESCSKCEYSKWIGVDGYGNYCSHPNNKKFYFIYDIEKCNNIENKEAKNNG